MKFNLSSPKSLAAALVFIVLMTPFLLRFRYESNFTGSVQVVTAPNENEHFILCPVWTQRWNGNGWSYAGQFFVNWLGISTVGPSTCMTRVIHITDDDVQTFDLLDFDSDSSALFIDGRLYLGREGAAFIWSGSQFNPVDEKVLEKWDHKFTKMFEPDVDGVTGTAVYDLATKSHKFRVVALRDGADGVHHVFRLEQLDIPRTWKIADLMQGPWRRVP